MTKSIYDLGASMYVPATKEPADLAEIGNGIKFPALRSVIFCTEDAVTDAEVHTALKHLSKALPLMNKAERPMRFVRVRNPYVMGKVLSMTGIEKIDGFVLPKLTRGSLRDYLSNLRKGHPFWLMPTLETLEVFDREEMTKLRRNLCEDERTRENILCLRIGGNDLLRCLGIRRDCSRTIYDTPLGVLIPQLVMEFSPHGFGLTGPVFESFDPAHYSVLRDEVERDLQCGLFGKTAIHPTQIAVIEDAWKVSEVEYEEATRIVAPDAPAVFKCSRMQMCEPTTHAPWAQKILQRAQVYGIRGEETVSHPRFAVIGGGR
ncbi:MAG TPA: HpcH/HpaI aldolase/citrate lyase family protein [Planktothrix sp.]|jgi:citrate lyase beta subunit